MTEIGQKGDTVNIRVVGFPDELDHHLPRLLAALGDHTVSPVTPVEGDRLGQLWQVTIVTNADVSRCSPRRERGPDGRRKGL